MLRERNYPICASHHIYHAGTKSWKGQLQRRVDNEGYQSVYLISRVTPECRAGAGGGGRRRGRAGCLLTRLIIEPHSRNSGKAAANLRSRRIEETYDSRTCLECWGLTLIRENLWEKLGEVSCTSGDLESGSRPLIARADAKIIAIEIYEARGCLRASYYSAG